jgi:DNA topoisomerase-1
LVIVESPAKARTIERYLGNEYSVKASVGHIRDLLRSQISVDVENDFKPKYRVPNEKRETVKELKTAVLKAEEVFLATDPDREGEAIAWHLLEAADIEPERVNRVVFNEVTEDAILNAFSHPRSIDMNLVDAQQARRILDRLVGYNISPILWSKVRSRLSAGRVQSAALRLIVEREREIENFIPQEYWTIDAKFEHVEKPPSFKARLTQIDRKKPSLSSRKTVDAILGDLRSANYQISKVKRGTRKRRPSAPFTTSTLQQSASRRLNLTARQTMALAQQLYEGIELGTGDLTGLITYMRTDSTHVSKQAQVEARKWIAETLGERYLPESPPQYRTRSQQAQEAHEAIRPTSVFRTPDDMKECLDKRQWKLYRLIWNRFVASQMKPALYDLLTLETTGNSDEHTYLFRVTASSLRFSGFLEIHADRPAKKEEDPKAELQTKLSKLPDLVEGDPVELIELFPDQHFTQPPARFSDASLVKMLEEHGIGRPSTYAPVISTIMNRGYVEREKRRFYPTDIGILVNDLVVEYFPDIVDLGFTARMEQGLDEIAVGNLEWVVLIRDFYGPFSEKVEAAYEAIPEIKAGPEPIDRLCPESGHPLVIRHGRFGKFIGCSDFPKCRYTEPLLERIGVKCPIDGADLVQRRTRKGRTFYGCENYPACDFTSWKRPISEPCPNCGGLLVGKGRETVQCTQCETSYQTTELHSHTTDMA